MEIEIRDEGEAENNRETSSRGEQNRAAMRFRFEVDGIGRG
jgi:hypothetical protein